MTSFSFAREMGKNIRVHGNGFIQIDLPEERRLHVWGHPSIPRQVRSSQIHDHRFAFDSRVLVGGIVNVIFGTEGAQVTHDIYEPRVRQGEDTTLVRTGRHIALTISSTRLVSAGETYSMWPGEFHETFVNEPTATLMTKTAMPREYTNPARVLVPVGRAPDNQFTRYDTDEATLWAIVRDVLGDSERAAA